jgi:glycosyltransferase involved in cell wall biosynthesis
VDVARFARKSVREVRNNLFADGGQIPTIVSVGRLVPAKDHLTLLRAIRCAFDDGQSIRCVLVGDGVLRGELESAVRSLRLESAVTFRGECDDVASELWNADVFVLSSKNEGLPVSVLEAMAAGAPVVATDVGGVSTVVRNEVTGLLVPPESPKELSRAIVKMVSDANLRKSVAAKGRQLVEERFGVNKTAQEYERLYDGLIRVRVVDHWKHPRVFRSSRPVRSHQRPEPVTRSGA